MFITLLVVDWGVHYNDMLVIFRNMHNQENIFTLLNWLEYKCVTEYNENRQLNNLVFFASLPNQMTACLSQCKQIHITVQFQLCNGWMQTFNITNILCCVIYFTFDIFLLVKKIDRMWDQFWILRKFFPVSHRSL